MRFDVDFNLTGQVLQVDVSASDQKIGVEFGQVSVIHDGSQLDPYTGSYEVTPKVEPQVMETRGKRMTDNVTVNAIPYYETSNTHNGKTIIIGG